MGEFARAGCIPLIETGSTRFEPQRSQIVPQALRDEITLHFDSGAYLLSQARQLEVQEGLIEEHRDMVIYEKCE